MQEVGCLCLNAGDKKELNFTREWTSPILFNALIDKGLLKKFIRSLLSFIFNFEDATN